MRYLISLLISNLLIFQPAFATLNNVDKTQIFSKNLLSNGGFENGKAQWTPNDTADFTTSTTTPLEGGVNAEWDADAAADTLTSTAVTIPSGWYGRNGVASCLFVTPSGTATHEIQAYDGSNVLSEATITSSTSPTRTSTNFIFPSSGSISLRIYANADEPNLEIDSCFLGPAEGYNVSSVSQATFVGGMENAGASTCSFSESTSSGMGTYVDLGTSASCAAWTVVSNGPGTISAQATNDHRLVYTNMPPGNYTFKLQGSFYRGTAGTCLYRLSDGTNNYQSLMESDSANAGGVGLLSFDVTVTTAATRTYKIQAADDHASSCVWYNYANYPASWKVYRFPTSSEQAYTPDTSNWLVDVNIGGANPALSTASVSSYTGIEDAGLTLTNSSAATITARIPCSSTNSPSGTTCSAGSESVGVNFNLPRAGTVEACASFAHTIAPASNSADNGIAATFQIVETASNAQTVLTEGGDRKGTYDQIRAAAGGFYMSNARRDCSIFKFASAGEKTLRLMYEQVVVGTINGHSIYADQNTSYGGRDIKITVRPLDSVSPAPVLTNMVTTSSSGGIRENSAEVSCAASASITQNPGSWLSSIGNRSGAACTLTVAAGVFSAAPYACHVTIKTTSVQATACNCTSATACTIYGAAADYSYYVTMVGPR